MVTSAAGTGATLSCLWPGLFGLWYRGNVAALSGALGFALVVNLLLLATFVWTELFTPPFVRVSWIVVAVVWLVSGWRTARHLQAVVHQPDEAANQDLFIRAQSEYLRGHWFEAEALLQRLLAIDEEDVDARMMLASLLRHADRLEDARRELRLLERLDGADKWRLEIEQERCILDRSDSARPSNDG